MKKVTIILVLLLTLCTLTSCKYNVSKNKSVTSEEASEFIKDMLNPFYEGETSFVYTEYNKKFTCSSQQKDEEIFNCEIYGKLDKNVNGQIHYDATKTQKYAISKLNGNEKTKYLYDEIGNLFLREDNDNDKYFFIISSDAKIPDGKIKQETLKSILKEDSIFYTEISKKLKEIKNVLEVDYSSDKSNYDISLPSGSFYYISNNKLKVVESTDIEHIEEVFVFDEGSLASYKYTSKRYFSTYNGIVEYYTEKELKIKNTKEVKVPNDAEYYKTEYQKFIPGFFDYISLETILVIVAINLIIGAAVFVLIRILKRPKFRE